MDYCRRLLTRAFCHKRCFLVSKSRCGCTTYVEPWIFDYNSVVGAVFLDTSQQIRQTDSLWGSKKKKTYSIHDQCNECSILQIEFLVTYSIPIDLIFIEVKNSILSSNLKPDSYKTMTFLITFSYENRIDDMRKKDM